MSNEFKKTAVIKQLLLEFTGKGEVSGYSFKQLKCSDKAFIYKVSNNCKTHYEVFQRKVYKKYDCIAYPKARSFGYWASTYLDYSSALIKFNQLNSCD